MDNPNVDPNADPEIDPNADPAVDPEVDPNADPEADPNADPSTGDDPEYFESDEEFLKSYHEKGLPDSITSVEDAMDYALKASEQAKTGGVESEKMDRLNQLLAQKGLVGGVDALLAGGDFPSSPAKTGDDKKGIFPSNPAMEFVENEIRGNRIKQDDVGFFRHQAEVVDTALEAVLQPVKQALGLYARQLTSQQSTISEMEWNTFPKRFKDSVKRHELDALINANRAGSYHEAFKQLAFSNRPELLRVMADIGSSPPKKGTINKPRRRGMKRTQDFMKYLNDDGSVNQAELHKLDPKKRLEVLDNIHKQVSTR